MARTIHIRNIDEKTYQLMWNLRKKHKARSWEKLIKILCERYEEEEREKWL